MRLNCELLPIHRIKSVVSALQLSQDLK